MSDNKDLRRAPTADAEFDGCLLDAFCEDEGFAFAKLEEIEWQSMQRGGTALSAAAHCPSDTLPLIVVAG